MAVHFEPTQYGFKYGSAEVTRLHSDDTGRVVISIESAKASLQISVTKTGKVRVFGTTGKTPQPRTEWSPCKKDA